MFQKDIIKLIRKSKKNLILVIRKNFLKNNAFKVRYKVINKNII